MSSALKALKKLRKKAAKHGSKNKAGDRALQHLSRPAVLPVHHKHPATGVATDSIWSEISQQVVGSVLVEVTKPLKPLLDWFEHGGFVTEVMPTKSSGARGVTPHINSARMNPNTAATPAILRLPFKSPPCKRCPARSGGICQCAAKRFA
ncbi:hypothetical protein [Pragia fontium]|uniref:Uncharacterized protein n=2 Tax=Pragia fontium TaxID=82985 RepID=A0AAJ5BGX0_9GAMM|nr:hypothetical protein [Pragia fontium]AKJ43097.1 hypothetical protein QQ39_14340 [Pragia fontium]SFC67105.1 hypothetical protein SAMN02745723_103267 [Pragia fontium DSM 5563 = ATCC 49100]SUB83543.1 Uncharacterised protein [Pragia fontium]VEJ56448.1 Uncharacterised protein [Pragia fontium]GKX63517.1 hypothetical protein SOASR032_20860 [Pragia fontium]